MLWPNCVSSSPYTTVLFKFGSFLLRSITLCWASIAAFLRFYHAFWRQERRVILLTYLFLYHFYLPILRIIWYTFAQNELINQTKSSNLVTVAGSNPARDRVFFQIEIIRNFIPIKIPFLKTDFLSNILTSWINWIAHRRLPSCEYSSVL